MLIPLLASATGLLAVLFVIMAIVATRRAGRIQELESSLAEQRKTAEEADALKDEKVKQVDELRSKLDRARDEAKKAKKKAFDHEQASRSTEPTEDEQAARADEEARLEAKADAKKYRQQAEQAAEEASRAQTQVDELKAELREAKLALEQHEHDLAKAKKGEGGQVEELTKKLKKANDKLKAAERRSRNDAQVYRVTNSKLELAMEKIGELEKQLAKRPPPPSPQRG